MVYTFTEACLAVVNKRNRVTSVVVMERVGNVGKAMKGREAGEKAIWSKCVILLLNRAVLKLFLSWIERYFG